MSKEELTKPEGTGKSLLIEAIIKFQKGMPKITKNKEAGGAGAYKYKYADLATIWDAIRGSLADNKLAVVQTPTNSGTNIPMLKTTIYHESGESVSGNWPLMMGTDTSPQKQGSAITYARRYSLCSMLGIVADDDTDAVEHRTLSTIQKQQLTAAAIKAVPELADDRIALVNFLEAMTGKHPSRVLESEFKDALQAVKGYSGGDIEA